MIKTISLLTLLFLFAACNTAEMEQLQTQNDQLTQKIATLEQQLKSNANTQQTIDILVRELGTFQAEIITTAGNITVRFFPDKAPLHVMNFVLLSNTGFYNGVKFHRVIKDFMIQGGDPNSKDNNPNDDGTGGTILNLPAEFNDIHHAAGILSMARSPSGPNTASSQFFIMHAENPGLNNQYSVFGAVVNGMEVVNRIATSETIQLGRIKDRPAQDVVIRNIRIYKVK